MHHSPLARASAPAETPLGGAAPLAQHAELQDSPAPHPAAGSERTARTRRRGWNGGWRGLEVVLLYVTFTVGGFAINGIGSILLPLQPELGVDRSVVAFYPTLFAAGPLTVGLVGVHVVRRLGQRGTLAAAYVLTMIGAAMLGIPVLVPSAIGAFVLGFAGALVNVVLPVRLAELHPSRGASLLSEANGIASVVSILAPSMIGAALGLGLGWRAGYLIPIVVASFALLMAWFTKLGVTDTVEDVTLAEPEDFTPGTRIPGLFERWLDLPLAISAEFAIIYWCATALTEWHNAETSIATAAGSAFLAGMALMRLGGARVLDVRPARQTVLACTSLALLGFALFWAGPALWVSILGLFLSGAGIALLYPASVTRLLRIAGSERQRASQYAILASGLSVALAPLLLAALAGVVGVRWAYLMVPALLLTLLLKNLRTKVQ